MAHCNNIIGASVEEGAFRPTSCVTHTAKRHYHMRTSLLPPRLVCYPYFLEKSVRTKLMKFSTCEAATYHPLIHETLLHAHDTIQLSYNFLPARKKYLYVIPPPPCRWSIGTITCSFKWRGNHSIHRRVNPIGSG